MKRNHQACIFLLFLVSLFSTPIHQAYAPPLSDVYVFGLVSTLDSDIRLSQIIINMSIAPDIVDGENLTHDIEAYSCYNITNTADHRVCFLASYVRNEWTPLNVYSNSENRIAIEGVSSMYNASIVNNITTRVELPAGISARYPSGFFSSYSEPQIDLINITLVAHAEVVLIVETNLFVNCRGNYIDLRYGLDMQKLETDSANLIGRLDVSNTSLLVRTDLLNSRSRTVDQIGDSLVAEWSISDWEWGGETTYPGQQLDDDCFSDYFGVQLWRSEYFLPTPNLPPDSVILVLVTIPVVALVAILVVRLRLVK